MHFIATADLGRLIKNIEKVYDVYLPFKKNKQRFYSRFADNFVEAVIGEVRTFEPIKSFLFRSREKVAENFQADLPEKQSRPLCLLGVKACDLKGLVIQDFVFSGNDIDDPFYSRQRESTFIISSDCTSVLDTCFCTAMDVKPYPQKFFDINLSPLEDGCLVEAGSKRGQELIDQNIELFTMASAEQHTRRDATRYRVVNEVEKNIKDNNVPNLHELKGTIKNKYESGIWAQEAETCVECGACNTACPTCHCFLLYDQKDKKSLSRYRVWDSCLVKDFARVAGGHNPRPKLWMRLRNRFEKKFDFFPQVANEYACTGCGRCISACPGKIDIRRVLSNLVK